ncbi:endopeptidase [Stenotrophomonas sp. WZN-1]|uniref:M23 family metallopeptidase n=1 Tax=Stenotrophomonas sp. WZN-1 TaxID=2005046 RepID=UPI000B442533|nr:M23 family metallopeptidase [Stenotrophomonas sp. WZN-1]ARZ75543.1 endopeptidase [Stenotrophomonas sp. WZN-1]
MRLPHLIVLGVVLGLGLGWWLHRDGQPAPATTALSSTTATAVQRAASPTPTAALSAQKAVDAPSGLLLPVQGVAASQLRDTFTDARSEGRVHDAIDIMADAGTPVLAVADGTVEKLFDSARGGLTIYQFEPSGRWCYYYAHLQRYADGLAEKQVIKRGDVIGYVGSTGNASADAPHLHFEVHVLGPEKQWWKGESINPYPLLKSAALMPGAASAATPE